MGYGTWKLFPGEVSRRLLKLLWVGYIKSHFNGKLTVKRHLADKILYTHQRLVLLLSFCLAARVLENMDDTVDPCHDFYEYSCGTWARNHVVPEDSSTYTMFDVVGGDVETTLKGNGHSKARGNQNVA